MVSVSVSGAVAYQQSLLGEITGVMVAVVIGKVYLFVAITVVVPFHSRNYFDFSEEVKHAMNTHKPIVALESTIITHGMPPPHNRETAAQVEEIVRLQVRQKLLLLRQGYCYYGDCAVADYAFI